jgi:LPS sulfotransferase NodH
MVTSPAREMPANQRGEVRSKRLDLANAALERAWSKGWSQRPPLESDALLAAARRDTGLDDFGPENGWRERLERLTGALHGEAALTALGTTIAYGQLVSALSNRLRAAQLWREQPEIARVPITAPIVVVGQMRSGSTRMQRLLACDERFAFTRFYESWNPVPRWRGLPFDDRRGRAWFSLRVAHLLNPQFGVIHPTRSCQPDEEIGLHNVALFGAAFEAQWRIPSFARHGEQADGRPVYAEFRRHLQMLRWLRGEAGDKPWVLKLPQFAQDLDALLHAFPDARLVYLDRDPVTVVGSSASLVENQMRVQSDHVDRVWIGQETLHKVGLRQDRMDEARRRHGVPVAEVSYEAMQADWRGEIGRVYAGLGFKPTAQASSAMERYMGQRGHGRLQKHRYDIADYGLTKTQVRAVVQSPGEERLSA